MTTQKKLLLDVVVIRDILIVLLVFYHAFAIFSGGWTAIDGYPEIPVYWWCDKLSYSFLLELFVFVSGYTFGYQVRIKGDVKLQAKELFVSKFKRLIIPCVIFSFFYILLFMSIRQSIFKTAYDLLNGVGHMWFLPMLFWCFVGVWLVEKLNLHPKFVIPLFFLTALLSFSPIPFRMGKTMYYILFFYLGYILQRKNIIIEKIYKKGFAASAAIVFLIFFTVLTLLKEWLVNYEHGGGYLYKLFCLSLLHFAQIIYSSAGIIMMLSISGILTKRFQVKNWMIELSGLSFGVYLFQQFILKFIYYRTEIPSLINPYLLPWVSFVVTLFLSILFSWALSKNKIGRLLIG